MNETLPTAPGLSIAVVHQAGHRAWGWRSGEGVFFEAPALITADAVRLRVGEASVLVSRVEAADPVDAFRQLRACYLGPLASLATSGPHGLHLLGWVAGAEYGFLRRADTVYRCELTVREEAVEAALPGEAVSTGVPDLRSGVAEIARLHQGSEE